MIMKLLDKYHPKKVKNRWFKLAAENIAKNA
jgi:hypothetical protein